MSDELGRRLAEVAAAGERADLPAAPDAVRRRARKRQQRRRARSGGALAAIVIGVTVALASGSGSPGGQKVNVGGSSTTVVTPTTSAGLPTPTTFVPSPTSPVILPPDGPRVVDVSKLSALSFDTPKLGYALIDALMGSKPRLARTQDGGATWHLVGPSQPFAAASVSRLTVSGLGLYAWGPGLAVSQDGGASWRVPAQTVVHNVEDLGIGGPRVWAVGNCNTPPLQVGCPVSVITSDDRGATWSSTPARSGALGLGATLAPLDRVRAFVASFGQGGSADLHLTADGGTSWQPLSDPCQTGDVVFHQVVAVMTENLWLVCAGSPATIQQGNQVYRSADSGRHWNLVASVGYGTNTGSITLSGHVNRLVAIDDTRAWLALDRIGILVTTDGGRTWHEAFSVQTDSGPVELATLEGTPNAWAIAGQAIWRTTDGVTWTKL